MNVKIFLAIVMALSFATTDAKSGQKGSGKGIQMSKLWPHGGTDARNHGFPQTLIYNMQMEGHGNLNLQLEWNRFLQVPARTARKRDGTFSRISSKETDKIGIYTDKDGHGSYACILPADSLNATCQFCALVTFGEEACFFGPGDNVADCTMAKHGALRYYDIPSGSRRSRAPGNAQFRRSKRQSLPEAGHKTVEIAFIVDQEFMSLFYERHPGDTDAAEQEADVFITLLANEMNVYYSTVKEVSNGDLDIYVYPSVFVYPEYGEDFEWSSNHFNGTYLHVNDEFDTDLRAFVNSDFTTESWDHAMAISGHDVTNTEVGDGLLGYAYLGTVCAGARDDKLSIIEYSDFNVAATAAHELGHALSAEHDETTECPTATNVMSADIVLPSADTADTYHYFSTCSVQSFQDHLNSNPDCTAENGFTDTQFEAAFCAGFLGQQDNNLDLQCQKKTDWVGSTACNGIDDDVGCYRHSQVACRTDDNTCSISLIYVWNGTPCGTGMMCYKGRCQTEFEICGVVVTDPTTTSTNAPTRTTTLTPRTVSTSLPTRGTTPTTTSAPVCDCCSCCGTRRFLLNLKCTRCCRNGVNVHGITCSCC